MASVLQDLQREAHSLLESEGAKGNETTGKQQNVSKDMRIFYNSKWQGAKTAGPFTPSAGGEVEQMSPNHKRLRRRQRRKSSGSAETAKMMVPKGVLFVEFPTRLHGMNLKAHLKGRMRKTVDFSCELLPNTAGSTTTVAKLTFPSMNAAKSAASALKNSNLKPNMIPVKCVFNEMQLERFKMDKSQEQQSLESVTCILQAKVTKQLGKHDIKLEEAEQKLKQLRVQKHIPLDQYETVLGERETIQAKLSELKLQRDEFCSCVDDAIMGKLMELPNSDNYSHQLRQIRMKLGVEMTRLDKAFPIYARRREIVDVVVNNPVCVVLGETGSGKSTQMPQFLYEAGLAETGLIVCTQPRKIAATSLATHVSSELVSSVGQIVGYKVGMRSKMSALTKIMYMTDHMLLNEILSDPTLSKVSCVIVDEAHERSIYTDLLLGMVKKCMSVRPELKVVITSATIDPEVFVEYFCGCPVVKVSGRTFPVEVIWQDPEVSVPFENHMQTAVQVAANIHEVEAAGDILVFLTSPLETEKCCSFLEERLQHRNDFKCMQIHGKLQAEEQQAVFEPLAAGKRKIVFATNSAETSVTIPGIKYVVDSGLVKEMQYDPKKSLSSLDTVVISQSSAEQRKGRAGRMSSGKCFRLYTEEDYNKMKTSSLPEILRVHLAQALLKLLDLGVDPLAFDFVQSPSDTALKQAVQSLEDLGAWENGTITDMGKRLALLPFEPRLGKLLLTGIDSGIPYEAISMAALITMGSSIFYRAGSDAEKKQSDLKKTRFCHADGDHFTMMSVYQEWFSVPEKEKSKWCVKNSINGRSMRLVREMANEVITVLKKELKLVVKVAFLPIFDSRLKLQDIIFQSSKQNLAVYLGHPKAGYLAPGPNQKAQIHPASSVIVLGGKRPAWVLFEQLINTSKDFLTSVSPVSRHLVHEAFARGELKFDPKQVEQMMVTPLLTKGLGKICFFEFVGRRFANLRVVEEQLVSKSGIEIACLDADRKLLQIQVHVNGSKADVLDEVITSRLKPVLSKLQTTDHEIPLHKKSASVRAIVGCGGNVLALLFCGEYRTVFIDDVSSNTEASVVEEWLSKYGTITNCNRFRQRLQSRPQSWGTVTFSCSGSAVKAVEDRKDALVAKVVPCASPSQVGKTREFTIKLSWTRRHLKGFGFITMKNPEDMCQLLKYPFELLIDGKSVRISLNKKDQSSIYAVRLPDSSTEDKVTEAVHRRLGANQEENLVERVALIRQNVDETTPEMCDALKNELEASLFLLYPAKKLNVEMQAPGPKTVFFTAYLRLNNPNEGVDIFNAINDRVFVAGEHVEVSQDLATDIFIPKYLLPILQTELECLEKKFKTPGLFRNVSISSRKSKAGHCYIKIKSESPEALANVKREYDSLLAGKAPDLSEFGLAVGGLFRKEGRDRLTAIEKSTGTIIRTDYFSQQVLVLGNTKSCQSAFDQIKDYVRRLVSLPMKKIGLSGEDLPLGLMKKLLWVYGIDLAKFQKESRAEAVELDFRQQVLTVTGTEEALRKAIGLVQGCINELGTRRINLSEAEEETVDCVVCFCPIPDGELHRLNLCGHPYCQDCVKLQVRTAVDKRDLPLTCAFEGCNELWCWKDVEVLVPLGGRNIEQLMKAALDSFISQHKTAYNWCLTPDCPGIFPVSSEGKLFVCEGCETRICTSCKVQYHDGLTCAMYNSTKNDPGLSDWLKRDEENNKLCPKCKTPIEKNGGCLHMTCLGCKIHICWVCMDTFSASDNCYRHLRNHHGRIGDEYPM